ncbi:unnamed protein product [Mycena citricolor]|uniref:Uncharacterized protein n=1 Tax=Mycena citricolor TaxID=2018698 RepID=A0AAD2K1K7_9AGAR|nr:unnamed protein product [Mycena citricolor]CAK5273699.1 unnamed protein product [Mycena citricolor]
MANGLIAKSVDRLRLILLIGGVWEVENGSRSRLRDGDRDLLRRVEGSAAECMRGVGVAGAEVFRLAVLRLGIAALRSKRLMDSTERGKRCRRIDVGGGWQKT